MVRAATGVCKSLFKGPDLLFGGLPTLYLPVLFHCVVFDELAAHEHDSGPESERRLMSGYLILLSVNSHMFCFDPNVLFIHASLACFLTTFLL